MGYTDLTSTWAYKGLVKWKQMDQHAENAAAVRERLLAAARPIIRVKKSGVQTIPDNAYTQITGFSEDIDTQNTFSSNRWTPGVSGAYLIDLAFTVFSSVASWIAHGALYKNGALFYYLPVRFASTSTLLNPVCQASFLDPSVDENDYFEAYGFIREPVSAGGATAVDCLIQGQRLA